MTEVIYNGYKGQTVDSNDIESKIEYAGHYWDIGYPEKWIAVKIDKKYLKYQEREK